VGVIGVAGLFSGLSSNIYFPSLDAIAKVSQPCASFGHSDEREQDLNVSIDAVSLTITSYLIIQGVSPLLWGSLSDTVGRRPIYIASFTVYIISNIVLSLSPNFPVLLAFRGLQAAGSASTVSIGKFSVTYLAFLDTIVDTIDFKEMVLFKTSLHHPKEELISASTRPVSTVPSSGQA
jgi:MFS family permease